MPALGQSLLCRSWFLRRHIDLHVIICLTNQKVELQSGKRMDLPFSQRMGLNPIKRTIQVTSMDEGLRNALWNDLTRYVWRYSNYSEMYAFLDEIWMHFFRMLLDAKPVQFLTPNHIRIYYFHLEWYEVYDFIEFVANRCPVYGVSKEFVEASNYTLQKELSAYRFVGKKLVPITSEQEIAEIETALTVSMPFTPHLDRALDLLADRQTPDYRNSIKESISAVEALCQLITGSRKGTLEDALRKFEIKLGSVHPALKEAFRKLYAYTGDAEGIRHALLGESDLDVEDAKFMLIACSAFINYLVAKADKAGIPLPDR